jgi:hypothetical protein
MVMVVSWWAACSAVAVGVFEVFEGGAGGRPARLLASTVRIVLD